MNNVARVNNKGMLAILKDVSWPTVTTYLYRFLLSNCTSGTVLSQSENFKAKLIATKGTEITWIDQLGVSRVGFLITDEPEFVNNMRGLVEVTIELMESLV
ncbi:MAG: hypothetical protein M0R80_26695 [Proteobacteria bacterium]|jgi:hypothetical protein|nr:hypothetical protein [Pseudomonadota bacterium]